ncbi:MAG: bifunctional adenosylcobinamide kinase/adenosylcobinamide-phosphate guanylyltransferase [Magnetococcales bacterium]|nr:bifunctional adenosylcobinamide kinase/adenosylcobinamide-phosphate guanylyltransferase [Magnetococcales bacterium]
MILGGARSGKSDHALHLARESGLETVLVATATVRENDTEMASRIARHRASRPAGWRVIEEPCRLGATLARTVSPTCFVVVDCLTLWLTNLLLDQEFEARLDEERNALLGCLPGLDGPVAFVSNETGLGVVPMGELSRRFVDECGTLHQDLARLCDQVTFMVAGLPMTLKGKKP